MKYLKLGSSELNASVVGMGAGLSHVEWPFFLVILHVFGLAVELTHLFAA